MLMDRLYGRGDGPWSGSWRCRSCFRGGGVAYFCTVASGHTSPIASGSPVNPSQQAISTSATPPLRGLVSTLIQCLAPSPPVPTHRPRTSRSPSALMPSTT